MANTHQDVEPGSEMDLAIERALEAASLRPGDATTTTSAHVVDDRDLSAAEAGGADAGADGD